MPRGLKTFIVVAVIVGLSAASLAFNPVNISLWGSTLERGGTGPLGLKLGLDLQGGSYLVYQSEEPNPTSDQMVGVVKKIEQRVNALGVSEPAVQQFGENRVMVQLPGIGGSNVELQFEEPLSLLELSSVLKDLGYSDVVVRESIPRGYGFTLRLESLTTEARKELQKGLAENLSAVKTFQVTGGIENAKKLIGTTAQLVFKVRDCEPSIAQQMCVVPNDPETGLPVPDQEIGLTGEDLEQAFVSQNPTTGALEVNVKFKGNGVDTWADTTKRLVNDITKRVPIFLDDVELTAPVVRGVSLDGTSVITGNFTTEEARTLAIQLESGRLDVPLKLIQESDIDAVLGADSLRASLMAGLVGLALVLVFMVVYYRVAGLVAAFSLVTYAVMVLAIFKMLPVTLTLSGMAGFILSIGMAVDANVLIFERMKEELRTGRTLSSAIEVGFNRAWTAIRDSNVSTFITCGILYWFGSRMVTSLVMAFAATLFIGVAISMFTAIIITKNLLQFVALTPVGKRLQLFTPERLSTPTSIGGGGK